MNSKQAITTDLVGAFVQVEDPTTGGHNKGTIRAAFLDSDSQPKLLVQLDGNGKLVNVYATTQVVLVTDYRGLPVRERKR